MVVNTFIFTFSVVHAFSKSQSGFYIEKEAENCKKQFQFVQKSSLFLNFLLSFIMQTCYLKGDFFPVFCSSSLFQLSVSCVVPVCLLLCFYVCFSLCLLVFLFVCLSVCISPLYLLCLTVCPCFTFDCRDLTGKIAWCQQVFFPGAVSILSVSSREVIKTDDYR